MGRFFNWFNSCHTEAYKLAQVHYGYAMDIEITKKQKEAVEAKADEIRELWDNLGSVITIDDTTNIEAHAADEYTQEQRRKFIRLAVTALQIRFVHGLKLTPEERQEVGEAVKFFEGLL